jgi:S-DNA-T family DNA segregation ATPase FtsK/SpoIIIE
MLFKPLGTSRLQRVRGAFVTEDEIALVVEAGALPARSTSTRRSSKSRRCSPTTSTPRTASSTPDEDALLDKAIEVVVTAQTASVSFSAAAPRRLHQAGRLIDMLERRRIISPYEGSKPRRVLVSEHELERTSRSTKRATSPATSLGAARRTG